jgi:hypothetical protein
MNAQKPQGKDDPKGWSNGDGDDLRDPRGGTYGEIPRPGTPEDSVIDTRSSHQNAQQGADVRSEPLVISSELPEGLKRERKGPLNPRSGRRESQ